MVEAAYEDTHIAHDETSAVVRLTLSNIGQSPAINVALAGPSARASKGRKPLDSMRRRVERMKRLNRDGWRTIFPERPFRKDFTMHLQDVPKPLESPFLVEGAVTYRWRPGGRLYVTPFIFTVKFWREGEDFRPATTRTFEHWHYPPE